MKHFCQKVIALIGLSLCLVTPVGAVELPKIINPSNNLQIEIPGMSKFSEASVAPDGSSFSTSWIAEYIVGVYRYGIGIIGIVAMLATAIGGAMWVVSAGNPSRVGEAKAWISSALVGLALGLGSYILLNMINSDLTNFKSISISRQLDPSIEGDDVADGSMGQGGGGGPWSQNIEEALTLLQTQGVYCPRVDENLDSASLQDKMAKVASVAQSFNGKIVYRWGSKNGRGSDTKRGATPSGKLGYDCSGFVRQVLWCAGFNADPGIATNSIFPSSETITKCSGDTINGIRLEPGDLVGWPCPNCHYRHVLIYIGQSTLADSHGTGTDGSQNSYGTFNLCDYYNSHKEKTLYIKRVRQYQS